MREANSASCTTSFRQGRLAEAYYANVPLPTAVSAAAAGSLIARDRVQRDIYLNDPLFRLDQERLLSRVWICVGQASLAPRAGDYVSADTCRQFRSPYHPWLYRLHGSLLAVPVSDGSEGTGLRECESENIASKGKT